MRNIYYSTALFHKAIKRNLSKINYVTCNDFTDEIYFVTQKAIINLRNPSARNREIMEDWLKNQGVKVRYVY